MKKHKEEGRKEGREEGREGGREEGCLCAVSAKRDEGLIALCEIKHS